MQTVQCRQCSADSAVQSYVAEFTSDTQHVTSVDNPVADALSQPPELEAAPASPVAAVPVTSGAVDFAAIATHQPLCPEAQKALASSSLLIKNMVVAGVPLLCYVSRGTACPVVPAVDRQAVFAAMHGIAHLGIRATR